MFQYITHLPLVLQLGSCTDVRIRRRTRNVEIRYSQILPSLRGLGPLLEVRESSALPSCSSRKVSKGVASSYLRDPATCLARHLHRVRTSEPQDDSPSTHKDFPSSHKVFFQYQQMPPRSRDDPTLAITEPDPTAGRLPPVFLFGDPTNSQAALNSGVLGMQS